MLLEEFEILRPAIEPEDVPGAFYDEIGENTCIGQMKVDNQIVLVLDERPIHVGKPVDDHQHHTETGTHAHHEAGEQRQPNQQVAIFDKKRRNRRHCRRREDDEYIVERLCVIEKPDYGSVGYENLMRRGVQECLRHEETKVDDQRLFHR